MKLSKKLSRRLSSHLSKIEPNRLISGFDTTLVEDNSVSSTSKDSFEKKMTDPSRGPALRRMNFKMLADVSESDEEVNSSLNSEDESESDAELADLLEDLDIPALPAKKKEQSEDEEEVPQTIIDICIKYFGVDPTEEHRIH